MNTDKYEGHTPGPWQWKKDSILLKGKGHRYIITGRHLHDECSIDKEADAQLIADAPDLLAEVERMRAVFDTHGECHLCGFTIAEHACFDGSLPVEDCAHDWRDDE